jgi:PH domain
VPGGGIEGDGARKGSLRVPGEGDPAGKKGRRGSLRGGKRDDDGQRVLTMAVVTQQPLTPSGEAAAAEEVGRWERALSQVFEEANLHFMSKKGVLWKKGHKRRNWSERTFVLAPLGLSYFDGETPKGMIPLVPGQCRVEFVNHTAKKKDKSRPFCMEIIDSSQPGGKDKSHLLDAGTEAERKVWYKAIVDALDQNADRRRKRTSTTQSAGEEIRWPGALHGDSPAATKNLSRVSLGSAAVALRLLSIFCHEDLHDVSVRLDFIDANNVSDSDASRERTCPFIPSGSSDLPWLQFTWPQCRGRSIAIRMHFSYRSKAEQERKEASVHLVIGSVEPTSIEIFENDLFVVVEIQTSALVKKRDASLSAPALAEMAMRTKMPSEAELIPGSTKTDDVGGGSSRGRKMTNRTELMKKAAAGSAASIRLDPSQVETLRRNAARVKADPGPAATSSSLFKEVDEIKGVEILRQIGAGCMLLRSGVVFSPCPTLHAAANFLGTAFGDVYLGQIYSNQQV